MSATNDSTPKMPAALQRLADTELSSRSRMGYVGLLLMSVLMSVAIGSLWATEPSLPTRTQVAFAAMVAIGVSWCVFALRVLTSRRILLARHAIVAGRMAVTFTSIFVVGTLAAAYASDNRAAGLTAASIGMVMAIASGLLLRCAHRRFEQLEERRRTLERQMDGR
jgi:membrane associated rhomboid family serine protease